MQLPTTIRSPMRSSLAEYARMRLTPGRASSVNFMPLKYPLLQELVIVVADLYLPEEGGTTTLSLPGLERIARFGSRQVLRRGWRPWLARRVGLPGLADAAPACIAARGCPAELAGAVWLATPVHMRAGLSRVHLEQRGLLKLSAAALAALAADFRTVFHGSGFRLEPIASGGFILAGPSLADASATEPARWVGTSLDAALQRAPALRRLSAEIELWLHEHPVNRARSERGQLPVTSLWLWGAGELAAQAAPQVHSAIPADRASGCDPYLEGLWSARGARVQSLPQHLQEVSEAPARLSIILVELAQLIEDEGAASLADALQRLDARWIAPAVQLVARGRVRTLSVVANDRCLTLARGDGMKLWRRASRGLAALV